MHSKSDKIVFMNKERIALYLIFVISAIGMLGSLYFSEVLKFAPCVLCWYQRIALYPIAIISFIAIVRKDFRSYVYMFPLAVIGWLVALYQNLLIWGVIPESLKPCVEGVSCTTKYIEIFGFITIPFLSFASFTVILLSCIYIWYKQKVSDAT